MSKYFYIAAAIVLLISAIFRWHNLDWGAPYYFHPDERNIASSVTLLKFPDSMNPQFFAYGSLPIYIIYFTGVIMNFFNYTLGATGIVTLNSVNSIYEVAFDQAIVISRFYSALYSFLLIPLMYILGKKLKNNKTGVIAAVLTTTSTGLIQFSHFGTFEMWLTFYTVLLYLFCLKLFKHIINKYIIAVGILLGVLIGIKVSHFVLAVIPMIIIVYNGVQFRNRPHYQTVIILLRQLILLSICAGAIYITTNPYTFLDYHSFLNSMKYESGVALGTLPVFYTEEFTDSIPVLFQIFNIYPFLINPLMTILLIPSFAYLVYNSKKHKYYSILALFFLIIFFSSALIFAKWTRYMIPSLPFIYLIISLFLVEVWKKALKYKFRKIYLYFCLICVFAINLIFAYSYFHTAFLNEDSRKAARNFAYKNIPHNSVVMSEVYDLGITPFNNVFPNIELFNFYDLENNNPDATPEKLTQLLKEAEYIILPSQRILKTRLADNKNFPNGHKFYTQLFSGEIGFQKIYQTPCDLWCIITYLNSPVFSFEQTANVFDRPTVFIFKKSSSL